MCLIKDGCLGYVKNPYKLIIKRQKKTIKERIDKWLNRHSSKEEVWMASVHVEVPWASSVTQEMNDGLEPEGTQSTPSRRATMTTPRLGEGVGPLGLSYTLWGGRLQRGSHLGSQLGCFFKHQTYPSPHNPAVPIWDIYSRDMETCVPKKTCTVMFVAAFFIIAKAWNSSVSTSRGMEQWTGVYSWDRILLDNKKGQNTSTCDNAMTLRNLAKAARPQSTHCVSPLKWSCVMVEGNLWRLPLGWGWGLTGRSGRELGKCPLSW